MTGSGQTYGQHSKKSGVFLQVAVQSASLVKAIYLRAQCFVAHKEWKRAGTYSTI
jgi:hypothetical protein